MGIGDWGLGIGDWGLGIGPNPQSPIPNPPSPIPNPQKKLSFILITKKIIFLINKILPKFSNKDKFKNEINFTQ